MKSPLLIFLSFTNSFLSQSNWTFGIQQGNVVYQKLNPLMTHFLKENDKDQFSYNRLFYLSRNIKWSSRSTLGIGLSFEKRKMRVLVINDSVIKRTGGADETGKYFTKKVGIKTDMVLINHSQGLNLSYKYISQTNEKRQIQVGGSLHNYFITYYRYNAPTVPVQIEVSYAGVDKVLRLNATINANFNDYILFFRATWVGLFGLGTNNSEIPATELSNLESKSLSMEEAIIDTKEPYIYPNPGYGNVYLANCKDQEILLLNAFGQEMRKIKSTSDLFDIDLFELPSGIYYFNCQDGNKLKYVKL